MARRYRAFISYSHADERWAAWLQRSLERYRVPGRLRKQRPGLPARLNPVFRDKEELASSGDLGDSIRKALARSEALIVVCSPAAAASRWVNEEIRAFRELAPGRPVLCLLVAGSPEPVAPGCAFPPALLHDDAGRSLPEPLAADPRGEADGKRGAVIKIAAGLLRVGVDALRQRDQQRRNRVLAAVATGAAAVAVVTVGLAINASIARDEAEFQRDRAEFQRSQAEDLIEFMLVDLRDRLQPIGRLDVLDAVGDQALAYFARLGDELSAEDALSRVMALRQIGEVRFGQGRLAPALEAFTASRDFVEALHRSDPGNDEVLFELGQAEFWVGYVAWERKDLETASGLFANYMQHSRELLERDPENPDYRAELMYAFSNLGSVALEAGRPAEALEHFEASNAIARRIVEDQPQGIFGWIELREGLSWSGSTLSALGDLEGARVRFSESVQAAERVRAIDDSPVARFEGALELMLLAGANRRLGEETVARELYYEALRAQEQASAHDPSNARWRREMARTHFRLAELALASNEQEVTGEHLDEALTLYDELVSHDPTNLINQVDHAGVWRLDAERWLALGVLDRALERALAAKAQIDTVLGQSDRVSTRKEAALIEETLGRLLAAKNDTKAARDAWLTALGRLPPPAECDLLEAAVMIRLLHHLGRDDEAAPIRLRLNDAGFRDPTFPLPEESRG